MSEKLGPLPDKSGTLWELRTPRNGKPFQYWTEQDLINYAAQEVAKERERCADIVMAQLEACAELTYGHTRADAIEWAKEDKFDSHCEQAEKILAVAYRAILSPKAWPQ